MKTQSNQVPSMPTKTGQTRKAVKVTRPLSALKASKPTMSRRLTKSKTATVSAPKTSVRKALKVKASGGSSQVVQARVSVDITQEASLVLKAIGLNVSEAFRLFLVRVAHDKALPFSPLKAPNKKTLQSLREAQAGRAKRFESVDDLMADLSDDE